MMHYDKCVCYVRICVISFHVCFKKYIFFNYPELGVLITFGKKKNAKMDQVKRWKALK